MIDNKVITIHEKWHSILGEEIPLIEPHDYVKLSKILAPPKLTAHEMNGSVAYVLHYIRQKVKMWGADVLRAENIKTLVEEDDDVSDEESESSDMGSMDEGQDVRKNQLSRFDCLASLLASVECTVAQDIFRTLSQFPVALPLTIPELDKEEMFKVMLPLLVGPVIKWETKPGTIVENHLFNDRFRLIVAIRIGTNSPGKSVILNQLMASDSMFSSSCEPRAEYGIPHMINGSIEFTWLTQETCGVSLWNDVFENYYKEGAKEIALLANLHGDALDYPDQIKFLKQLPSSFLIFLMPGCTTSQIDKLEALIGPKKIIYGWVNKKNTDKKKYTIDTKFLMKDKTLKKVRMMFKEALDFDTSSFNAMIKLRGSLQLAESIELAESQLLADFVKEKTCRHIKLEVMQLQRKPPNDLQIWKNNTELQYLIFLYINILKLPLNKRIRALAHLEREVSRLSMIESSGVRNQAVLKREELRKSSLVDSMSLGLEHFFRELGQIYKISSINDPDSEIVLKLPELYAQLLIGGHTIELLDGDAGSISEAWFSAICGHICNAYPRLRIFVVSILGLQSSGKSTLLNALFACRFAVSVGRCTRGLFMRLLFLEKNLSDQLGVDAFVLIDTEGLGAPEKMDDPESEKKDRILATFAMGVSNLTILNVLGESTRDLTEILQIAIVTMARLEEAGIAPDIMMVQHVSERNAARLSEPEEKFRAALQEALKIAKEQDIEMGISNTDCLQILDERIKKGQLLKQFRPFKNGATAYAPPSEQYHEDVVNLYNSIINDCKNSQSKIEFSKWHSLIQDYWNAVSHEDFAVRFKNIREIYEFIDLGKRITKLKETIDKAFLKHEESIMQKIRKSTLLNALFACRFAVSVGRCTRGLFMRLLFLEKNLSDQLGVDAFVLIDTEGLGAPEKMDDPESEKKDRILATFAMGVSNLTILNVLGESTRDLTEILQIAIVTMARLEEAGIAPDIMMVQHVSERNAARLSEPEEKFRAALQEALKIAKEQDIEMGISNTDCLQILDERIKKGQLLKQFRPFKNGATAYAPPSEQYHEDVVNLYNSIINDCKNSQSKIEFSKWHSLIQDYWNAVSHEDFAVRFKNIREIYEFIDLGKRITKLKETIDKAFLKHEESIMQKIRTKLQSWSPNDRSNMNLRHQCLELIEKGLQKIPDCNDSGCEECESINKERIELEEYLKDKNNEMCEIETKQTIEDYIKLNRHSASIKLTQMLDASFIRKGISSESLDIINNRLEGILRNMPSGRRLTDYQRKKEVEEIWSLLRNNILSKYNIKPIVDQIDKEVKDACSHLSSVGFYQQYMNGNSPDLSKCKAYKAFRGLIPTCLDIRDACALQEKLDNLVDSILEKRASYHYYPGIVRDLAKVIEKTLNDNASLLRVKFLPEFKWNAYLYALLKFKPKMISFQKKWEMDNTPLGILDQKKEEYLKMIDTRLQYGHTLVSEGHIAGDYLLRVIHKKAMDAGSAERKTAVRNIGWLTCTESVRLKYFENLAEQVQRGDKKEAIEHFSWPKGSIEYWFKRKVDGNTSGNPKQKYNDTFNSEFNRVIQEIRNCQSFEAIKKFINDYMTQVDKVDYKLDLRDTKDEDFRIFYHAVEEELKTKGGGRYPKDEPFQDPSKDKSIMELLGCTEACYFCGALCWGSQGHYNDSGETKRHHTSHQPGGLARFSYRGSKELVAMPCHKLEDNVGVWYFGKEDPTPWSVVKAHDFKDWRFESHYQHLFNDLMCWFFEKLHVDLANKYGLKPSTYNEMSKYGCINLSYSDIISTLRTKI
ncbi:1865_t:CDS:2 [Entrophospora sp. SA101]|nr:1865_t:CDS:2 [Entrophospora sp. SA101]